MTQTITLGGVSHEVAALPLGRLRKLLPALSRASVAFNSGLMAERQFDDVAEVLAAVLGKPVEEIEQMAMTMPEISEAMVMAAQISGLVEKGVDALGEAKPGAAPDQTLTPSTSSTPT